ncbi:MAG: hypothetical protein KatS3mg031_1275 [Chitinophagales bacterium]|nr:MAG: hypothetical protein KatS3mg031_1275 [Chitinophagales bacterium]
MKTLKFKTNINCSGCVAKVTPFLEKLQGIKWSVNTETPDKILEVTGENISEDAIIEIVKRAGFKIEPLQNSFFKKLFS